MVSNEWWVYHLTENGWVSGDYKHDFQDVVEVERPTNSLFSRRYFQSLGHRHAKMETGYDDISGLSDKIKELLKKFPHPSQFKYLDTD